MQELERLPDDTFKQPGETAVKATTRTQEELYKQYDSKLKEQQVSHVTTMALCINQK